VEHRVVRRVPDCPEHLALERGRLGEQGQRLVRVGGDDRGVEARDLVGVVRISTPSPVRASARTGVAVWTAERSFATFST
jgi:hypothetical protein